MAAPLLLAMLVPAVVDAAEDVAAAPLHADRPGFSIDPLTVERGVAQLEAGYQYTTDDGVDLHQVPITTLRYGLTGRFEVRADWGGYGWLKASSGTSGATDFSLGLRTTIFEHDTTAIGLSLAASIPVGAAAFSSDDVDPTLALPFAYGLPGGATIFGTLFASSVSSAGGSRRWQGAPALGVSVPLSDRVAAFVEAFSLFVESARPAHSLDFGLTFNPTIDVQLDLNGGVGLNEAAPDGFVGAGFAWRWH